MLSQTRYQGYEVNEDNFTNGQSTWLQGAMSHDIILQYQIISSLYNKNLVKGDSMLSNVINMGQLNYLEKMEDHFGLNLTLNEKI